MSVVESIHKHPKLLVNLLEEYEVDFLAAEDIIAIKESQLLDANRTHAGWQLYYDQRKSELHVLLKYTESQVSVTRSKLYVGYTQTHDRDLTEAGKKTYIDGEPAYIDAYLLSLEVREMYEKYLALCAAFQTRGFAINNLTKLTIANIEDISY